VHVHLCAECAKVNMEKYAREDDVILRTEKKLSFEHRLFIYYIRLVVPLCGTLQLVFSAHTRMHVVLLIYFCIFEASTHIQN